MSVTLSLRVTSDKRKPGMKIINTKEENLLPLIKNIRTKPESNGVCCKFLDALETAADLKAQLEVLRNGLKLLKNLNDEETHQEVVYFYILIELMLTLELKSPLRSGIVRILKEFKDSKFQSVKAAVSEGFKKWFATHDGQIPSILRIANAVCGCFDNFPVGEEGIQACVNETQGFIVDSLRICIKALSENTSPVHSTEVCLCTHALVRAALHVVSLEQSADFELQLHQLANQLISCDHLPLDTRTNCGLLSVTSGRHVWQQMLKYQLKSEDDLTSLCLYSGMVGCLSKEELTSAATSPQEGKTPVKLIFEQIISIHKRNPLQPTITLSVARTLVSLSQVMSACSCEDLSQMLPALLCYTWEHLEHVMDSVKHLMVSLLNNIVKLHSSELDVHSLVLSAMASLPMWGRARHSALAAMLGRVPAARLLSGGGSEIRLWYQHLSREAVSSHTVNAFQELMRHHYKEVADKEQWKELWIRPLIEHLDLNPSVPLQQVLSKALAVSPDVIQYILKLPEDQVSLGTTLLCLRLAHRLGLLDTTGRDGPMWRGTVSYNVLRSAVCHQDEQTRLSCLSLIVEAPKTTEAFTVNELHLLVEFISHNLHWDAAAARQRNIALLGKFVSRFNDSLQALRRRTDDEANQLITEYSLCKQQLEHCCVDSLFPGASYSRRVTALQLLLALRPAGSPRLEATLLATLADSYEEVKGMAVKLLTTTPGLLVDFNTPTTVLHVMDRGLEHAGGVKPPECLTAAYLLAALSQTAFSEETLAAIVEKHPYCQIIMEEDYLQHRSVYCIMLITADHLTQQLSVARSDLLRASATGPLHGLLFTIRLLLTQVNLKECGGEAWGQLIRRLVDICFGCSEAVASVVNNDSPEGHLPMDFDFDPSEVCGGGGGEAAAEGEGGVAGVTSQMALLCSWRTVKEASLLLGHLAEECSIAPAEHPETGLLSEEDVLKIGQHFTTLLAETKHRGAFEQAYVGFCKLVSRLWRLPIPHLQQLPLQWLNDTMEEISSSQGGLCATRRSAGVPFMVQALISTLLEVGGPAAVEPWLCRLLGLAERSDAPATTLTHALNILRALVRSTQLGEAVAVCVERAFVVTVTAFAHTNWMVRNSATLLLSALMTRVFGVPRSKAQHSLGWKNKMTGRIFFQRYPKLFAFFHQELQRASQSGGSNLHPSLYPVLLILGRLYPSSLEGTDSNVQLTQLIPAVLVCGGSRIYKTRTLAAAAATALMALSHLDDVIGRATRRDANISANQRHGMLLQVTFFFKQCDLKVDQHFRDQAENWIVKLTSLFEKKLSYFELEALFSILNISCEKYFSIISQTVWMKILENSKICLKLIPASGAIGSCLLRLRICELLLKLEVTMQKDDLDLLCCEMLQDEMYEVQHTVLDFVSCFCIETEHSDSFSEFYKTINCETKNHSKNCLLESSILTKAIAHIALKMLQNEGHPEDKCRILLVLGHGKILESCCKHAGQEMLTLLLESCLDPHDEVATNALSCLVEYMKLKPESSWNEGDIAKILKLIQDISASETSYLFSEPLHKLIKNHIHVLQKSTQAAEKLQMYKMLIELSDANEWATTISRVTETEDTNLTAALLLGLALGQFQSQGNLPDSASQVFDKEEVSSDYEEYMLSKVCSQKLNEMSASNEKILYVQLDETIRNWLAAETGLKGTSLAEFIVLARMEVLHLDTKDPCQFLNPGFQRLRLNWLRLNNIV